MYSQREIVPVNYDFFAARVSVNVVLIAGLTSSGYRTW